MGFTWVVLVGAVFMIFAHDIYDAAEKMFSIAVVRNMLLLSLASVLVIYFQAIAVKCLLFLLLQLNGLARLLVVKIHASGWLIVVCYWVALLAIPMLPWLVLDLSSKLLRRKPFAFTLSCIWGTWIILITTWLRL